MLKFRLLGLKLTTGAVPLPLKATVCGLPLALSVMVTPALRVPVAVGVKVTLIVQEALAASVLGQLLVWAKSPALVPVSAMLLMVRSALPLLVNVTAWAVLVVLTCWLPKLRLVGLKLTAGAAMVVPEPLKATVCGLPAALSVMDTLALRVPVAVGVKVTLMVQEAPAASVLELLGQVLVCAKSPLLVPVRPILLMVRAAVPLLVRVTVCAALVVLTF